MSDSSASEPHVYIPPNIRNQALSVIEERLESRRNRRMILAIEVKQTQMAKLAKMRDKDSERFDKAIIKAQKLLDDAKDKLNKAEDAYRDATSLHNSLVLIEDGLK